MRVLLVAGVDVALPGGLETHLRELARGLAARGHAVAVLGRASAPVGVPVVGDAGDPRAWDVIHAHGPSPRALDAHPGLVRTLHFCVAAKMAVYVRIGRLRTLLNLANWAAVGEERSWAKRPGRLLAVSERVRRDFARLHGLDPARVEVVPNGVAPGVPAEDRAALRARHGVPAEARVLLTIGRDDFVKGHGLLAHAWARVRARHPDALWVTVGGRAPARAPGRLVTGPVPHAEVASWIAAADLGALPSYYEGCSVALLEMLAGGLPTLAHDVGNAAEVIVPGGNGALVPPDARAWEAALERALAAPPARAAVGLADDFTWPRIVERVEASYRAALGARD
uniref:Glycosyltransferase family 1 protein n=1 Tax=Eiseniibacteriota bacterium TaxID=2212470 RepID=A0A832I2F9_UNCEI